MTHPHPRGGYVALVSALIISVLLSLLVLNSATDALLARFDTSDYADHLQARSLALSCVYAATFSFTYDPNYQVPEPGIDVFIGDPSQVCHIERITITGTTGTIAVSASVRRASIHIEARLSIPSLQAPAITSWKEINSP